MLDQDQTPADDVLVDMTPAAPPPPRSYRRLWLALVAVVVAGVTTFCVVFADNLAALNAYKYSPPKEFLGLPTLPEASAIRSMMGATSGLRTNGYRSDDKQRVVVVAVSEHPILVPATRIDAVMAEASKGLPVSGIQEVPAGDRGGVMKCGHAGRILADGQQPIGVCVWVDGSMWGAYLEDINGVALALDTLADHARELRRTAEVPS